MAGQEQQQQRVISLPRRPGSRCGLLAFFPAGPRRICAHRVGVFAPGDGDQPAPGIIWTPGRPPPHRLDQRLLDGVLSEGEVRPAPHQHPKHLGTEPAEVTFVVVHHHWAVSKPASIKVSVTVAPGVRKGRTSIHSCVGRPPRPGAEDRNAATSCARCSESTSTIIQPAMRSLVSANGPSVTGGMPSASYRTNVPAGDSAWESTYSPLSVRTWTRLSMNAKWSLISC